jgi:YfiH family protein
VGALAHDLSTGRRLRARVVFTSRADGDFNADLVDAVVLHRRQQAVVARPWTFLDERHGAHVVTVEHPGAASGTAADALVTRAAGAVLGIWVGDCAPVAFVSPDGVVGAAHAGWRGIEAGVLEATVAAMRALGARTIAATLGPCIHPECYEFGADDLARLTSRYGHGVRSRTTAGVPALDVPAIVTAALADVGVALDVRSSACTACGGSWWSHRARGDRERQALAVWLEEPS